MFTRDLDIFGDDGNSSLQGRIANYLSWMQTSGHDHHEYKEEKQTHHPKSSEHIHQFSPPPTISSSSRSPLPLLRENKSLRYRIHGFLNAVITQKSTFDRLDTIQILAYLFAYDDSFSVGERFIRIIRSHEQFVRSAHLISVVEKNAVVHRMLWLSTHLFRVGVLSSLVKLFFQPHTGNRTFSLHLKSLEYQHLSIARSILHLIAIQGIHSNDPIFELLLVAYRDYLATHRYGPKKEYRNIIFIPITEFITGLEAALELPSLLNASNNPSSNAVGSVRLPSLALEIFMLQLQLQSSKHPHCSMSDSIHTFHDELVNRISEAPLALEHLQSRLYIHAPQLFLKLNPTFNLRRILLRYHALEFASGTLPFASWLAILRILRKRCNLKDELELKCRHNDFPSIVCEQILACSHLGLTSNVEATDSELHELISLVLGPSMRPDRESSGALYPLLSMLWSKNTLIPLAQSLMNVVLDDAQRSDKEFQILRTWLVLEIQCLAFEALPNARPKARHTYNQSLGSSNVSSTAFIKLLTSNDKLDALTAWFRRSSLYEGSVNSMSRLQAEKFTIDQFVLSLFTLGGSHLSHISSMLNLSIATSIRSPKVFLSLLDAPAWIAIISLLWERKRYSPIVDFYKLFIDTNDVYSLWLPFKGTYLTRECLSEAEIANMENRPLGQHSFNGMSGMRITRPNTLFDDLFLRPLVKNHEEDGDPCEYLVVPDDASSKSINASSWIISKPYRSHHMVRLLDILIMTMVIKSHWRLLLSLLYRIRETISRAIPSTKIVNRLRSHIPFILENLCGGFILDHKKFIDIGKEKEEHVQANGSDMKYNTERTTTIQDEYDTQIEFFPREQPQFPSRPYLVMEIEQQRIPCMLPCLPDDMSISKFDELLSLVQWGSYGRNNRLNAQPLASLIPEYVKDVGGLRSYLKTDTVDLSTEEIKALQLIVFTVHIKPKPPGHNRDDINETMVPDDDDNLAYIFKQQ